MSTSTKTKILPKFDMVFVKRHEVGAAQPGGLIHLPASAKADRGVVVAVGPGGYLPNGKLQPLSTKVGDEVVMPRGGLEVEIDGVKLVWCHEYEIPAVLVVEGVN